MNTNVTQKNMYLDGMSMGFDSRQSLMYKKRPATYKRSRDIIEHHSLHQATNSGRPQKYAHMVTGARSNFLTQKKIEALAEEHKIPVRIVTNKHAEVTFEKFVEVQAQVDRKTFWQRLKFAGASLVIIAGLSAGGLFALKKIRQNNLDGNALGSQSVLGAQTAVVEEAPKKMHILSEEIPSKLEVASYGVSADMPKRLIIRKLRMDAYIKPITTDAKGVIEPSNNIHVAGWLSSSAKTKDKGLTIITGHTNGSTKLGVFRRLDKLTRNDEFQIENGDGGKKTYRVVEVRSFGGAKFGSTLEEAKQKATPGKAGVLLITHTDIETGSQSTQHPGGTLIYAEAV